MSRAAIFGNPSSGPLKWKIQFLLTIPTCNGLKLLGIDIRFKCHRLAIQRKLNPHLFHVLKSHFLPKPVWGKGDFHKVVNKFHEKLNRCYSQSVLPAPPPHYHQRNPNRIIPALAPKNCPRFTATCPPSAGETPCGRENPSDCPTISAPISQKHRCYCHTKLSHPNLHTFPYKFDAVKQAHSTTALCTLTIRIQTKGLANDFIRRETRTKEGRKWLAPTYLWHAL